MTVVATGFIRCEGCRGRKTAIGLGGIPIKCKSCGGVGYVKPPEVDVKDKKK